MSLDGNDYKMIRQEGQDTRKKIDDLHDDIKQTNSLLRQLLSELIKLNAQVSNQPWTTIEK